MAIVTNPQGYDSKVPTNIRLIEDLKTLAINEAERRGVTMARVINEALAARYNMHIEGEHVDGSSNTQISLG